MKTIKLIGPALASACVLVAVSAASALAAEPSFLASEAGVITSEANGAQTFVTEEGGMAWKCETAEGEGEVTPEMIEEQEAGKDPTSLSMIVKYSDKGKPCGVYLGETKVGEATISPAEYLLDANRSVRVEKPILIDVTTILGSCSITIPEQLVDNGVEYLNGPPLVVDATAVGVITWTGSGGACGTGGSAATYTGSNTAELNGGSGELVWMSE